jgi:hypothetical protein
LLLAAATRLANVATIFLSSGSLPLFELRPSLALSFHEQRKDFDLATHLDAVLVKQLVILEEADRFCPNPPSDSSFFKGFARGRFCRPQALDRPTLRNDPAFGTPRGDNEDFKRGVWREPIGKRGVLDAKRRPDLPFAWLPGNLASPDSPASPATFWRLATQRIGGKFPDARHRMLRLGQFAGPSVRKALRNVDRCAIANAQSLSFSFRLYGVTMTLAAS